MDVENYLKQKRELERKKEILEAKESLKETKEEPKRPSRPDPSPAHEYPRPEPTIKPWMIWDLFILIIVVSLFSSLYFYPHYNVEKIKEIIKSDPSIITGMAVSQQTQQTTEPETGTEPVPSVDNVPRVRNTNDDESLPGPEFRLTLSDRTLGDFDSDGKIDNQIIEITSASPSTRYEDLMVKITNEERETIQCEIDKDVKIDENIDGAVDARDYGRVATLEIDPRSSEEKRETVPATPEEGAYNGVGRLIASYKAKCVFCLDDECNDVEEKGKSEKTATAKIVMRLATNSTG